MLANLACRLLAALVPPQLAPSRRAFLGQVTTAAAAMNLLPIAVEAAADCIQTCRKNCGRLAAGSRDYCEESCSDYCAQGDRKDGLTGSISTEGTKKRSLPREPVARSLCETQRVFVR